jgi:hypothetical protein
MKRIFKRRWLFLALVSLVLVIGVYVWLLALPHFGRINQANFDKIQIGMTKEAVKDLLGPESFSAPSDLRASAECYVYGNSYGILPTPSIDIWFVEGLVALKGYSTRDLGDSWNSFLAKCNSAMGRNSVSTPVPSASYTLPLSPGMPGADF